MVSGLPVGSQVNSPKAFKGYVPVPRSFFDHPIWTKPRVFSQQEALLDLYRLARCLPTETLKRGEFQRSAAELATRWTWSQSRVKRFMAARVKDGTLREVPSPAGDISIYAVCEVRQFPRTAKTPTKPVDEPPAELPAEPPKPAPVVEYTPAPEPPRVSEPDTPGQKKESNKERKASEFRSDINGENPQCSILEQPARSKIPAVSPPVELRLGDKGPGSGPTDAERAIFAARFASLVPIEQYRARIPLSRTQVIGLRNYMTGELLPWPKPGTWFAAQMRRPV